ncbi:TolC family outer membrane protein [Lichenihabitans psoromatis]|uniref:TolC family outer membrane protein n=1 Tax=Lichenihabitans psoromatis TaxID=2528642 RepID=UPI001035EFD7|nr:TolC family outer membrane protein [Lichenihabitans psoromatis]
MLFKRSKQSGTVRFETTVALSAVLLTVGLSAPASAESLNSFLTKAYVNNPQLNAQRAGTRATDENVPLANSGYLPKVSGTGSVGFTHSDAGVAGLASGANSSLAGVNDTVPRGVGLTVTQTVFDGFKTPNSIRQAESNVFGSRETLRNTEQSVLQSAAQSYMDVLRDTAVLDLRSSNIKVLDEQLRQTQDRFKVGEVTRTDVAQAEAGLAGSRADFYTAQSNLQNSIASFRQVVGVQPTRLEPARPLERGLPPTLATAINISQVEHPSVQAALHQVDAAALQVKIAEGALYPTVSVQGSLSQEYDVSNVPGSHAFVGAVVGSVSIPLYEGGADYATIRQAKETLTQSRLLADVQRENVRAAVISAWGLLESSKATVTSDQASVNASEIALNGVREEARVGQRTTLDVLNAQQTLLNSRVALVGAQRDRVVASYAVLATIGRLSTTLLGLNVKQYNPVVHFEQVKDKWYGMRTPDGK